MGVWRRDVITVRRQRRPGLTPTPSHGGLVFQHCVMSLCSSSCSELGLQLITDMLTLRDSSYWLVRTELLETLAEIDFR